MVGLFSFDESSFAKKHHKHSDEQNDHQDSNRQPEPQRDDFEVKPLVPSPNLNVPETNGNRMRRRSSVYRRVSIRRRSSVSSHTSELVIPANFNKIEAEGVDEVIEEETSYKRVLSDFVPLKVLGKGAYGKVHLVQDRHTKKLYAQKQLRKPVINIHQQPESETQTPETQPPETHGNPHTTHVKRTIYERQILSSINHHPNIVKMFYALQDQDKFYLILEYIPGGELFHHLTYNNSLGNVFKEDHVSFYAAQMALGLRHLHKLGIVYRDLKPENCLLDTKGNLVLTDFGLSKDISDDEQCTSFIGTPEYMAPEILRGKQYSYPVDWWSLGCVIIDMMSGKPPFTGNSHKAIQQKILTKKLAVPYYFSLDAQDLLNKLLNKNPAKRFPVDQDWDKFTSHRFFRKLNWKSLETQDDSIVPPIVPIITDPILAENFAPEFTNSKLSDYNIGGIDIPNNGSRDADLFEGFSYTASNSFIDKFS